MPSLLGSIPNVLTTRPFSLLADVPRQLIDFRSRAETLAAVAVKSGLIWNLHASGLVATLKVLRAGQAGPSTIYKIHGANTPDKPSLIYHDRVFTYGELDRQADRIAAGLWRRGLGGKSVLVMMKNCPEYLMLGAGTSRAGVAMVTVSWRSTATEVAYLANHCGADAIVFDGGLASIVDSARPSLRGVPDTNFFVVGESTLPGFTPFEQLPSDEKTGQNPAEQGSVVVYTSGTTGKPKGAVRKFSNEAIAGIFNFLREAPFRCDDIHLAACPVYHTTAFGFIAMTYMLGATVVLLDDFDPIRFLEAVEHHRVTTTVLVPTMLHRLLKLGDAQIRRYDTRSLRAIFFTSAPLPGPDSTRAMELFGNIVYNLYGSTETGVVTLARPSDLLSSPGTIGRAVPGNEIRLLDDEGREVPEGCVGELYTKNATLVSGYHNDESATRESMRDGYFSVGDLARRDVHGCYHLEGRKRDMIISGGVNVYPAEVEAVLESHPMVDEVAVIGVPDPEWGERVQAVIVLNAHATENDWVSEGPASTRMVAEFAGGPARMLKAYCKERLAGPKVPREFVFLSAGESLPRNPTGKVLKRQLRARAAPLSRAGVEAPTREDKPNGRS